MNATMTEPQLANRLNGHSMTPTLTCEFTLPDFVKKSGFTRLTRLTNGWLTGFVTITPALAAEMLGLNAETQRNLRNRCVAKYANDISTGYWRLTHQGIAFNKHGKLIDGQHRLNAIIAAGCDAQMLVFFGVGETKEQSVIDTGAGRSASDAGATLGCGMHKAHASVVRLIFESGGRVSLSHSEILVAYQAHEAAITYAVQKVGGFAGTGVMGGIAVAYYNCDLDKLSRFISVVKLDTPATQPGDRSAIALNKYLTDASKLASRTRDSRKDIFLKTMRAVQASMNGEELTILKTQAVPAYSIPVLAQS